MLYAILEGFAKRPALLPVENVADLHIFIQGYLHAASYHSIVEPDIAHFEGFQTYVEQHYKAKSTRNWSKIIQFHANSDKESLLFFHQHLEAYKKKTKWVKA
jgi:hypothetical protein